MAWLWCGWSFRRFCPVDYREGGWSITRGGCRFEPGHEGPHKPGKRR